MRREQIGLNLLEEMDLCEGSRTGLLGEGEPEGYEGESEGY